MQDKATKRSKVKMISFDEYTTQKWKWKTEKEHNPKWTYIVDYPCRILIIRGSGLGKNKCVTKFNKQSTRHWWNI